jgi:acetyltransferase-like isoleucine patch superfamily enzyme
MLLQNLLNKVVVRLRGENFQIDKFSNKDILRIFLSRFYMFFRGLLRINLLTLRKGFFFLGRRVSLVGIEKISFGKTITVGNNVKISTIGASSFSIGDNFTLRDGSIIDSFGSLKLKSGSLIIGNNVGISEYVYIAVRGNIVIGNDVIIGPSVKIFSENHSFLVDSKPFRLQEEQRDEVSIGNNVWIGANVVILPGVIIGDNTVIAAGAVVTKSFESNVLLAGSPARIIRNLI